MATTLNPGSRALKVAIPLFRVVTLIAAVTLGGAVSSAGGSPADSGHYWEQRFGKVSIEDNPLAARAAEVFLRVRAAAARSSNREPRLLVLNSPGDPWAMVIADGSVLLSLEGLETCYRGVSSGAGDARLAFVLGHELAHLASDDFWHAAAFSTIQKSAANREEKVSLLRQLRATGDVGGDSQSLLFVRTKELRADVLGMIYLSMAGYDPRFVVSESGTNFIGEWVGQMIGEAAYSAGGHPAPEQRKAFVKNQMQRIVEDLEYFDFGIWLLSFGKRDPAIQMLERFRQDYPGREVMNALGMAYFQAALQDYTVCDREAALRFKFAMQMDTVTLATGLAARSLDPSVCRTRPAFEEALQKALSQLEAAVQRDPSYLPAKVNLSSALLLDRQYSRALAVAEAALKLEPGMPGTVSNQAVAIYELGRSYGIASAEPALALLRSLGDQDGSAVWAHYNAATIYRDLGDETEANHHLHEFLRLEPLGSYASLARELLGGTETFPGSDTSRPRASCSPWDQGTTAKLPAPSHQEQRQFRVGTLNGHVVEEDLLRSMTLRGLGRIEEYRLAAPRPTNEFLTECGAPLRRHQTSQGEILVYPGVALRVVAQEVVSVAKWVAEPL